MACSTLVSPVLHYLPEFAQIMSIESMMLSNHLTGCHSLLLLPSIFPSIRVFSSGSALHVKWPEYWSFSFSTSPSNEYSGLISFRIDWFDLLAVQTLRSLLQHLKALILQFGSLNSLALSILWGFPGGASGKEPAYQCRRHKGPVFNTWVRKIPRRRA